ncbi:cytochrome P450 [Parachitinimonas caeni]|uniref:Cytochrome P450 n=1 Tax=Parachitinimonas caeni TaxID=3031301 RepID=A0ABT7DZJ6_9NEIS|nr:cytochrome P450 [Parachitinimonas caeni]MDK2125473.1 cytochrome P450 [Parachitinimonas caeni]
MSHISSDTAFLAYKKQCSTMAFPSQFAHYAKARGAAYYWEPGKFFVVTSATLAREVLSSANYSADRGAFFISRMPEMDLSLIGDFFSIVKKMMVMSDDEAHIKRRRLAHCGFEEHILERFTQTVEQTVKTLVGQVKQTLQQAPGFEFVHSLSKQLPSTVLADFFSIPEADREHFFESANCMTGFFGGASSYQNEDGIRVNRAARALKEYFENLIHERRGGNGTDYVSILLRAQAASGLSDEELIAQLIMMLVAGQVTTTDQINNIMYLLAANPEIAMELKQDREKLGNALEEFKRFDPAVTFIFRVARTDCELGGLHLKPGDVIFIANHCVSRDLPAETLPDTIQIARRTPHMAYGHGAHHCLGAKLGRLEIRLLFAEILRELPLLRLDPAKPAVRDHYSLSFSGFSHLSLLAG